MTEGNGCAAETAHRIDVTLSALAGILRAQGGDRFPLDEARAEARALLAAVTGRQSASIARSAEETLPAPQHAQAMAWARARAAGMPLSRITGRRGFWTLDLAIGPATLDPRADSETVVEAALAAFPDPAAPLAVLDLGTGSGCLLLAVLAERPAAFGWGIDLAAEAVAVAQANAQALGLDARARFVTGDFADRAALEALRAHAGPLDGGRSGPADRFDLVLANPPYIPTSVIAGLAPEVRLHDPLRALDGGADGLDAYRCIFPILPSLLSPGGRAVIEHGYDQAAAVSSLAATAGLAVVESRRDLGGQLRCLVLIHTDFIPM